MAKSESNLNIKERFEQDKKTVLNEAKQYFNQSPVAPQIPSNSEIKKERDNVTSLIAQRKYNEALLGLEKIRDAKSGRTQTLIQNENGTPVLVSDARAAKSDPVRQTESFEMQYLNAIRSGMDLSEGKPELLAALQNKANAFFGASGFHKETDLSQKKLVKEEFKKEINDIGVLLGEIIISQAYTKLNVAKDFQNFKDRHANVVTISSIKNGNKTHTVIEAEVGMKGLTKAQKEEY